MIKAIIPCAGYGTRMNMPADKSKEMLTDPVTGKYLIDYSLDLCYSNNIEPVVISRIEKEDLNSYLRSKNVEHIVLKTPGKEWAETVLKSQGLWGDKNILVLPDTRWTNDNAFERIVKVISYPEQSLVIGYHVIGLDESIKWGTITDTHIHEKVDTKSPKAWGILAFDKNYGKYLFADLKPGGNSIFLSQYSILLKDFKDITRSGTLEKY